MQICYVATDVSIPGVTGGSTHTYELAAHLAKIGHNVFVICRREAGQREQELLGSVHVFRIYRGLLRPTKRTRWKDSRGLRPQLYSTYLKTIYFLYATVKIARVINAARAHVVLERGTSHGEGALASLICRRPLILELIGSRFSGLSFRTAKKVLCFSIGVLGGRQRDKVRLVTAAANTDMFNPDVDGTAFRQELGLEQVHVVGYAGSFAPWHGVETLLAAMRLVVQRVPETKLLFVGPCPESVRFLVSRLGLDPYTIITGAVPYSRVPAYLAVCDILAAPYSQKYGGDLYSYVKIFEYMAMARPVVTTNIVPDASLLADRKAAILVPPDNPLALFRAILNLVVDKEARSSLSQRGRLVASEHSWHWYAERLDRLLLETVTT